MLESLFNKVDIDKYCEIFKNTIFYRTPLVVASVRITDQCHRSHSDKLGRRFSTFIIDFTQVFFHW